MGVEIVLSQRDRTFVANPAQLTRSAGMPLTAGISVFRLASLLTMAARRLDLATILCANLRQRLAGPCGSL